MRISDWISDLCSSDLPTHTHQVPQVGLPQIEPVASQIAVNSIPGTAIARAAIPASGWHQTSWTSPATASPVQPPIPSQAEGTWIYNMRAVSPCLRSEEHTSELQSLMRISYAVFCLKKKTKNQ